ncbi:MAG: hypothetical protein M3Z20_09515 [Chloroflexota bacterium]|nr:hypothetical protein [Chloroflexota bacterium]
MSAPVSEAGRRLPDHILGVFARERLSEALSATHRAGFGPYTRVFDGQRSSTASQLARAGLEIAAGESPGPEDLVIVVQAPGRVDRVAEMFHQLGAQLVAQARRAEARSTEVDRSPLVPEIAISLAGDLASAGEA